MTLAAKAGTFITPASGASTVTGLGFRPGTIVLWTENAQANGVVSNGLDVSYGFWCRPNPTVATRAQAAWVSANTAVAANTALRVAAGIDPTRPVSNRTWAVSAIVEGVTNDGFTITYSVAPPTATRIHYLAFNTDAKSQILTNTFTPANVVGSIVKVRGAGFTPTGVLATAQLDATNASKTLGFGAADSSGAQWSMAGSSQLGVTPSNTDRSWSESDIISLVDQAGAEAMTARVVGYEEDGFNLQIIAAPIATVTAYFLCLGNVLTSVKSQAKPTTVTTQAITTPFAPKAALFGATPSLTPGRAANFRGSMGVIAGGVSTTGGWSETSAVATSYAAGTEFDAVDTILLTDVSPWTTQARASGTLTSTGTTLSWTVSTASAWRFGAFFVGNLKHPVGGDTVVDTSVTTLPFWKPFYLLGSSLEVETRAESAFGVVAVLGGDATVDTAVSAMVAIRHRVGGDAVLDTLVEARVALRHVLGGVSVVNTLAETGVFFLPVPLSGESIVETFVEGRVALHHTIGGQSYVLTRAESYFQYILPIVRQATRRELPGTVNWHINPGAEDGLTGWDAESSADIDEEFVHVWEGGRAVVVMPDGLAAGEGVIAESVVGTDLTGQDKLMWATMYASGNGVPVKVFARALYNDLTVETGSVNTGYVLTPAPNWQRLIAPPILLNPAKKLTRVEVVAVTESATSDEWYVDGAQIEEAVGADPTPYTSGAYGFEVGRWYGPPNRSVSIRQPLPAQDLSVGKGGQIEIEVKLYRSTFDNIHLEDITDAVIQGSVKCDPTRETTWTFDATMTIDGYERLEPLLDWVAPVVTLRYPDGTETSGQLGLYYVAPSSASYEEHAGTYQLSAFDPLWLVARQGFNKNLVALPGPDRAAIIRAIIDGAALTGGQDERPGVPRRYLIPNAGNEFKHKHEWDADDNRLVVANDIAESSGFFPLWTNPRGIIMTRAMGEGRLKERTPVRSWTANLIDDFSPEFEVRRTNNLGMEVIGRVPTTPYAQDLFDQILVVNDDPQKPKIFVKGRIKDKDKDKDKDRNRRKRDPHGGRDRDDRKEKHHHRRKHEGGAHHNERKADHHHKRHRGKHWRLPYLDDEATAIEVAKALTDILSNRTEFASLTTIIDPAPDLVRETISTAIWDVNGNPILVGHWAVLSISYSLWPNTPTMTMELSRIKHGEDDIDILLGEPTAAELAEDEEDE